MVRSVLGRLNHDIRREGQFAVMKTALQILHKAWPLVASDTRVTSDSKEDDITDILRRRMSDIKRGMDPQPSIRFERESQSDATEDYTELGLIDIMVCYTWNEKTYLVIECKRIRSTDNTLALKYVRSGINRFASGKYSAGHAYGVMIGYVLCGDTPSCIKRIQDVLNKEPIEETGFDSRHGWKERTDLVANVVFGSTLHMQTTNSNRIEITHSFVALN